MKKRAVVVMVSTWLLTSANLTGFTIIRDNSKE